MKKLLIVLSSVLFLPLAAQTPAFEDLVIEADSITAPYKPSGKNYALIKAKRGADGVTKTNSADSISALPITDIVLVFSELNANSINKRLESNQEKWENLIKTYPQFFQPATNLKEMCQCKIGGDTAIFRKGQGFYVYYEVEKPKVVEKKTEEKKVEKEVAVEEKSKDKKKDREAPVKEKKEKEKKEKKEKETVKENTEVVKEEPKEEKQSKTSTEVTKDPPVKRAGYAKPKVSKDKKACRPPCYEGGDEGLNTFFRDYIVLTKKQKKQFKSSICTAKLQLNFDGTIKKSLLTGEDEEFNKIIQGAINIMDTWYPAVKGGFTVKSEVKLVLKYDKDSKAVKPFEISFIPKPAPKCTECKTDSEIFGE